MATTLEPLPTIVFAIVMVCWFVFAAVFILRKRPAARGDQKKDAASIIGVAFQGLSYPIVWSLRRQAFSPILSGARWLNMIIGLLAVVAAVASVVLITSAVRTLGKEWSITARTLEDHELATTGPYARVRHPIYTGMLGMLIATGIAVSTWPRLLIAIAAFAIGTLIRVRIEEKLLRETFGALFDDYAKRVPALIPGVL